MPIMTDITVRISMLRVDAKYYSFNYMIWVNGKLDKKGTYTSDHDHGEDYQDFKSHLESGYATTIALENIVIDLEKRKRKSK